MRAQQPVPPQQDPLINLMLSQPPIELNAPVTATATFDPPVISLGQRSIYRVVFNALRKSIEWPDELPADTKLEMQRSSEGEVLQITAGANMPITSFNYRVHPPEAGGFVVTQFVATVYGKPVTVPAARLEVVSSPPEGAQPLQEITLEIPETNLFVGQPTRARVLYPGSASGQVQTVSQVQLIGEGFLVDQSAISQRIESRPHGGSMVPTYIYETVLTPLQAGKLTIVAQGFSAGLHTSGPLVITGGSGVITIPGGAPRYTLLDSEPVAIEVRPLPREGQLPGFTGAIGSFTLDPPVLASSTSVAKAPGNIPTATNALSVLISTNELAVGEPRELTVIVRGEGNFTRLVAPPPPRVRDWQVFHADPSVTPGAPGPAPGVAVAPARPGSAQQGAATLHYTLIPQSQDARTTPAIPFSFFDPVRAAYVDLTIPALPVKVTKAAAPADLAAIRQAEANMKDSGEEIVLSSLATNPGRMTGTLVPLQQQTWFGLAQLAPAIAFAGLWLWDRRRRYLEMHPEIVLRRRALRALRREWRAARNAARKGDAEGFAASAVKAMQVACAPHFPAEPRALVGSDVLELIRLPGDGRSTSKAEDAVRRFFSATDASRFAAAPSAHAELLSLRPEMEEVLERLEARL